jgi:hypothetical protein
MTSNKQVSPVIRISQGERDASARATHLEAATRKFLVTTNERKQMSTKTNFKRIALVAVASLGLSILSSVPSQAAVDGISVSGVTTGTATPTVADSTTAASFTVQAFVNVNMDALRITLIPKTTNAASQGAYLTLVETGAAKTLVDTTLVNIYGGASTAAIAATKALVDYNPDGATRTTVDTVGVTSAGLPTGNFMVRTDTNSALQATVKATFRMQLDSNNALTQLTAGTYTYTAVIRAYDGSQSAVTDAKTVYQDLTVTVAAAATASLVVSAANSTAVLSTGATWSGSTVDSSVSVAATASTTAAASINVVLKNASGIAVALESITATTTLGTIGASGQAFGRSVVLVSGSGGLLLELRPDGNAGTAQISISTPSVTFTNKTVTFYSTTVSKIVAGQQLAVLGIGSNSNAVTGLATDAAGITNGSATAVYAYSSNTAVVSNNGTACSFNATQGKHYCSLTGVAAGTATITLRNASTTAAATVASTEVITVTVNANAAASLTLAFDKASYAPNEKAYIIVGAVDSAGKSVGPQTITNLLSSAGISTTASLGGTLSDLTSASTISPALALQTTGYVSTTPVYVITTYMPAAGGTVTISAKGGTGLPVAGQVAKTASATVTDSGAAALAAVNALATSVASLRTLITTLTNLVLKIQKKVKA